MFVKTRLGDNMGPAAIASELQQTYLQTLFSQILTTQ